MDDTASVTVQPRSMGLPISNAKLAMWLFLATEIMFFSGLIGAYIVLRFGAPFWPRPADVHLVEWMGAVNTFVLICSSVTVVLAHAALTQGHVPRAVWLILATLLLAGVFLVIKAFEYTAKFEHHIIPGHIIPENGLYDRVGPAYAEALNAKVKKLEPNHEVRVFAEQLATNELTMNQRIERAKELRAKYPDLDLPEVVPMGNLWASTYFTLTGIHALHVVGGMVIFGIMLILAIAGRFSTAHTQFVELTGLYWHFVDIVWIFLFPLLYLIGRHLHG
jgi:cytochrome c oxidase subunit III